MSALAALQEKRNKLAATLRELGDKFNANDKKWPDGEAAKNWEQANADYDAVMAEMEQAKAAQNVENRLQQISDAQSAADEQLARLGLPNASAGQQGGRSLPGRDGAAVCTDEHRALAIAGWMRNRLGRDVSERHEEAARLTGLRLGARELCFQSPTDVALNELRERFASLHPSRRTVSEFRNAPFTTQTPATGGNIVMPEIMVRSLEINMLAFGGMRQVAEMLVTAGAEKLTWPTADDTGNEGEQIGENADAANAGAGGPVPTFAKPEWDAYKMSSKAMLVPYELLEDSAFNLPAVLGAMCGERIGRFSNKRYTYGTGVSQATGLLTAASLGVTAAAAAAITFDEVIELEHSVDPPYRNGAGYMANDATVLALRLLKDNDGQYLWQNGANAGTPDRLNNRVLTINQDMPTLATGNKTLAFGQFSKYKIRRVNGIRMYHLVERFRDSDQDAFIMFVREDGNLLDAGTAPVKYLQQA